MAAHFLAPSEVHVGDVGGDNAIHVLLEHIHLHIVVSGAQGVFDSPLAAAAQVELHQHGRVVEHHGSEIEVASIEALRVGVEHEAVAVGRSVKQLHLFGVVGRVLLESCFHDSTATRSDIHLQKVVL